MRLRKKVRSHSHNLMMRRHLRIDEKLFARPAVEEWKKRMRINRKRPRSSRMKVEHTGTENRNLRRSSQGKEGAEADDLCSSTIKKLNGRPIAGTQEMLVNLRRHGYLVLRIHTDSEMAFTNRQFKAWCKNRATVRTQLCPDEHQQNGRAEAAIASLRVQGLKLFNPIGLFNNYELFSIRIENPKLLKKINIGFNNY